MGDGVNLASRLEGLGKQYGVPSAGERDRRACRTHDVLVPPPRPRRRQRPAHGVEIYELLGRRRADAPPPALIAPYEAALDAYFAADFTRALALLATLGDDPPSARPRGTLPRLPRRAAAGRLAAARRRCAAQRDERNNRCSGSSRILRGCRHASQAARASRWSMRLPLARDAPIARAGSGGPADEPSTVRVSRRSTSPYSTAPPRESDSPPLPTPRRFVPSTRHGRRGITTETLTVTGRVLTLSAIAHSERGHFVERRSPLMRSRLAFRGTLARLSLLAAPVHSQTTLTGGRTLTMKVKSRFKSTRFRSTSSKTRSSARSPIHSARRLDALRLSSSRPGSRRRSRFPAPTGRSRARASPTEDKLVAHGGVQRIVYKGGKLGIKFKGALFTPLTGPVTFAEVRLHVGAASYCGRFATFKPNEATRLGGKGSRRSPASRSAATASSTRSEACDDGDLQSGDGCDANCTPTACGTAS